MPKYAFRTKTETYYNGHLVGKGQIVEAGKDLSKQYPNIFDLIGAENDVKEPTEPEAATEDKADEAAADDKKPANPTVDNMTKKELLELAEALHIADAAKMNVDQLRTACRGVLESK
ncbi:MAG: hypothetical protein IJ752_06155 [Alphaproteobacteria bacterium]|nr:hypothetical protein [Alphaproteobacteria bacterium]